VSRHGTFVHGMFLVCPEGKPLDDGGVSAEAWFEAWSEASGPALFDPEPSTLKEGEELPDGIGRRPRGVTMSADVETIVVGAGVVGLAVARALSLAGHETMVLEQHELIGSETSSRNSEVIHAGIYYPPGSLRAQLCVRGKQLLYAFCAENGVAHARCGKLLLATNEGQVPKLAAIRETAIQNGVTDLEPLGAEAAKALEPEIACVAALLSPSTGIIDSHGFMLALEGHIEANGGLVVLRCPVERLERGAGGGFRLATASDSGAITCRHLVVSAGLHATRLARSLSFGAGYRPPETYYAKGQYYALSGRSPFKRHIYPMPDGAWLGLHATVDVGGRCKFGPDISGSLKSITALSRRSLANSSISSAATIRASRSSAYTPTTRASVRNCTGRGNRCLILPSMVHKFTGREALSLCMASRAPGLRHRSRLARWWWGCWRARGSGDAAGRQM